tara:strand:- start:762 stop:1049 length:288 start_codon:yes stop_codon:yes gene_type:complete
MSEYADQVIREVFPYVTFVNVQGKMFTLPRERIVHTETYQTKDANGVDVLDHDKTFVNFENPSPNGRNMLHAVVDMQLMVFRDSVLRPAWCGEEQ